MKKSLWLALGFLVAGGTIPAQQYLITTVAGGGLPVTGIPAVTGSFPLPIAVAADSHGNVYFSAGDWVFKIDAQGTLTRAAGSARVGYSGDGGPATSAQIGAPEGLALDGAANLYIADWASATVRKVTADGTITTVAGNGTQGYSGDGGPATSAQLASPQGVAVDTSGNLYIADQASSRIRKVANGTITTVAGNGTAGYSGDGGPATSAQLAWPVGVAVDTAGNIYIADTNNNRIRKVAANGTITTVAGNGNYAYSGDGYPASSAQVASPNGVAVDAAGNLYIADTGNSVIREVALNGVINTVAGMYLSGAGGYSGDGGSPTSAQLNGPLGVALDSAGRLYIADTYNMVIRRVASGAITTVAGNRSSGYMGDGGPAAGALLEQPGAVAVDIARNLYYISDKDSNRVRKVAANGIITTAAGNGTAGFSGDGSSATSAELAYPWGVTVDGAGNFYIADQSNNRIREVSTSGSILTVAGNGSTGYGGDNGQATIAKLNEPGGVAVDSGGNIYIADTFNNRIRRVTGSTITTVVGNGAAGYTGDGYPAAGARVSTPWGVAVDAAGNLFIADTDNSAIRKVTVATGAITTVAGIGSTGYSGDGSSATGARLFYPYGVAVDAAGNLYIADTWNAVIRKVTVATGVITTVAGTGVSGYSGDGGLATSAKIGAPYGVAVDAFGNVYIADGDNHAIRVLVPQGNHALLGVAKTHSGNFALGQTGATYSEVVGNNPLAGPTSGTVTVTEIVPTGLTLVSMSGSGWSCVSNACTRTDALAAGASYPPVTVTVNVAAGAPSQVLSQVIVSGGGSVAASSTDTTAIQAVVLAAPVLVSPPNGASGVAVAPNLSWNAASGATSYDVYFGTSSPPPLVTNTTATGYAPGVLSAGATYYWQIAARSGSSSAASATWSFTIGAPPAAPVPVSPSNGATGVVVTPTLSWNAASGAASYDVYFGTSPAPPLATNTTATSYALGTLTSGATYYWQIAARNGFGTAPSAIWSFTTGSPAAGLRFVPVTPCRVADTRGGPAMAGGSTRSFAVPQSGCGIPASAQAYSMNVTVVPEGRLSYLTLWPTGQPQAMVSTLNSWGGIVVANAAIVPAGTNGAVSVFASDPTDVILDINGYFDTSSGPTSYAFYPATPCRIADTRGATGQFGGPYMYGGQTRDFPIPLSGCGLPVTARGYSLNVTVVPGGYLGYLSAWPTGQSAPVASTLNSWTGKVVANAALVPAGTNESISVYVSDSTQVILDGNGYFAAPGGTGALNFYPVTPCRVADTRGATGPFGGPEMGAGATRSFAIPASACNIPATAAAYSMNVTVVPDGRLSYLSAWPAGSSQPVVSTLNSWDGAVVANAALVPAGTGGAVSLYASDQTQVILDINGYFAP